MVRRADFSRNYWRDLSVSRSCVERVFGVFFHNRYRLLSRWTGKAENTFDEWAAIVYACIVIHNVLIKNQHKFKN